MPSLNIALKQALIATGQSQKQIAAGLGITESELSKVVRGHRPPSDDVRDAIVALTNKTADELFPRDSDAASEAVAS